MKCQHLAWFLTLWPLASTAEAAQVKEFLLAGQSNMEGQAVVDLDGKDYNGGKGTLTYLLKDPAKAPLLRHLRTAQGTWTVRASVWVRYQPERGPLQAGPLTVGYTPYADRHHFAYFGVNDFFPFNRAELKEAEPELAALLHDIWESAGGAHSGPPPKQPTAREAGPAQAVLSVADFLPKGYATDGSVSYQREIQRAIDTAARDGRTLVFPAMTYRLDESGLQLRSRLTLWLYRAVFRFDAHCTKAGHAFAGHDVSDVQLLGGEIVGRNDAWPTGVSIRGVYLTGRSQNIRIRDMHLQDLSSNGIGIFGTAEQPIRDMWITDVVIANCCNRYGDYLSDRPGPEKGSQREDQGLVACYHVEDFIVRGCRLAKSRSDGTHFYRCRRGQFVANKVYAAQMGGYFVETCDDILAADNLIRDNGSRGCTIGRGRA